MRIIICAIGLLISMAIADQHAIAGGASGSPGVMGHSANGVSPPETLRDRYQRAYRLALEDDTFKKELASLVTDALAPSGVNADEVNAVVTTIHREAERIGMAATAGMKFQDYVTAFADLTETIITANFPGLSLALSTVKVAVAFTTAFYYHLIFD